MHVCNTSSSLYDRHLTFIVLFTHRGPQQKPRQNTSEKPEKLVNQEIPAIWLLQYDVDIGKKATIYISHEYRPYRFNKQYLDIYTSKSITGVYYIQHRSITMRKKYGNCTVKFLSFITKIFDNLYLNSVKINHSFFIV